LKYNFYSSIFNKNIIFIEVLLYLFESYESVCSWLKILWENIYNLAAFFSQSLPRLLCTAVVTTDQSVTAIPVSN